MIAIVISIVLGIPALILAILSFLDTKRIRQELDGSLGTPAVQIRWEKPTQTGLLTCQVTAVFNRVSTIKLTVGKQSKSIKELETGAHQDLEFSLVPEGTKFKLSFVDPVEKRRYNRSGVVRYGQLDF